MQTLIPDTLRALLLANGAMTRAGRDHDPFPLVKLFTPDGAATWLLTELDPDDPDIAFGLCDLGLGFPELGTVSLDELAALRGPLGLRVERDAGFRADRVLGAYADAAIAAGAIVT
ncbi:transposase [Sphingopyxis sp. QXT-31]|uniref:DUF2958 domain-containing protein n=1 Tax=Sphingopyxis sp. QXT-31 TaxID=1357916 RepID=UPI0009791239|nr:DUF2958 domain-containing protein [Sphingopyxis sp. QXT-31]APZ97607.1 transposase [Sphingopyxis sp. QXT-31]